MFMMKFFITSRPSLYCTIVENSFILFTYLVQHFANCCLPIIGPTEAYTILNLIKSIKFKKCLYTMYTNISTLGLYSDNKNK